jgi:hypothetical protein
MLRLCFVKRLADVAQLVEHSLGKGEVISSILIIGSRLRRFAGVSGAGARSRNPERFAQGISWFEAERE